ncbi:hypothetical protein ACH5RR_036979 [Cinchona calisaya]|uniref:Transposase MuDR plant domain-containing protein n=1 Tax=Cinchona calisaya TaxID=153742 RepID=A0ABD2Y8L0_9GENT
MLGCLDYFDDCNPIDMKLSVLIHMTNGLGYGTNVGFMYKIPVVNGDFSLRKIEMEDDMVDMAAIGKQNGSVELYITQANTIAFLDSEVGQLGEIAEGDNEDSQGDSGSFDGEEFHDSDYEFCKDDDDDGDVIYNQSVATAGRDLSIVLGIKEVGHEEQGIGEPEQHEPHEPGQKHKHVKATDACDVNIFHGEQIQVNEESEFLNSDELNSIYSSSDEEVRPTSRFVLFRPETDMEDPNLYVGLQFSSKNEFKEVVENHTVKWGKEFRWKKNDSIRMRVVCQVNNCSWFVFASKMADSDIFVIKTMGPSHQCAVDEISGKERFQRMYICFEALKRGFREGCRPAVGLDGCHLGGPHPEEEPESFVNQCYSKDAYVRAYEPAIEPINGPNAWPNSKKDPIHAPKKLKLPGRPKKARRRELDERISDPKGIKKLSRVGITHMTCSGCHQKGHTVRKWPQRLTKEAEMQYMQVGESNVQAEMAYMQAEESILQFFG